MSDKTKAARERAKRLIRELQDRTQERGFTEAEALEAVEMIGKLMEKHDLELGEIGLKEEAPTAKKERLFAVDEYAGTMVTGIKRYCSLVAYVDVGYRGMATCYVIFGLPHDLEIATYLYEMLCESLDEEWGRYQEHNGYSMAKRQSFRMGFANRVYERLMELKEARDQRTYVQTGTALMVVKDQIVKSEFDKLGIKLGKAKARVARDESAFGAGHRAGDRANLNNPLSGGRNDSQIK